MLADDGRDIPNAMYGEIHGEDDYQGLSHTMIQGRYHDMVSYLVIPITMEI